jgi:Zn finger protein HypA/HybF involved in hydrogenase expression
MVRRRRRLIDDEELKTPCTLCGYGIPPNEMMRLDFVRAYCPACKQDFIVATKA